MAKFRFILKFWVSIGPQKIQKKFSESVQVWGSQKFCMGIGRDVPRVSVTSFSSHTSEARGLKFGMHNPNKDGSKVTNQIFDILP